MLVFITETTKIPMLPTLYGLLTKRRNTILCNILDNVAYTVTDMRSAIQDQDLKTIEVGLYKKDNLLAVHGIYEAKPKTMTDERSSILKSFLSKQGLW